MEIKKKQTKKKKTKKKTNLKFTKILGGFDLRSTVWKPNALSTKPSQTTRYL